MSTTQTITSSSTIESQLGVTQRVDRGDVQLIVHRVSCRLKSARTPLALISAQQRWSEAKPCTTCQPSARQMRELSDYIEQRRELERESARRELQRSIDAPPCEYDPELRNDPTPMSDDDVAARFGASVLTPAELADDAAERDELEQQERRESAQLSEQQLELLQRRAQAAQNAAQSELDTFLASRPAADVVPLTRRGKRNDKSRTRRHEQRDAQPRVQRTDTATVAAEREQTRECVDCHQQIKLTAFPTSTRNGERVRLDYCRKCRTVRATAKASKS